MARSKSNYTKERYYENLDIASNGQYFHTKLCPGNSMPSGKVEWEDRIGNQEKK
jgi:hypothetical protein